MATTAMKVRAAREKRKMTQEMLAVAATVSAKTIQRLEAGKPYSYETLLAVAGALDVFHEALTTENEKPTKLQRPPAERAVLENGSMFFGYVAGAEMGGNDIEHTDDAELVELHRSLLSVMEYGEIWDDIEAVGRYNADREATEIISKLREKRWIVIGERSISYVRVNGKVLPMRTIMIAVYRFETVAQRLGMELNAEG
jgi:transcriptional regulator with XRE-family HTH domain